MKRCKFNIANHGMFRFAIGVLAICSSQAFANYLGMAKISSTNKEPLVLTIPIATGTNIKKLKVTHAASHIYKKMGIIKEDLLKNIKIKIEEQAAKNQVKITSKTPFHTQFITLILEVRYLKHKSLYSVLVDFDEATNPTAALLFNTKVFAEEKVVESLPAGPSKKTSKVQLRPIEVETVKKDIVSEPVEPEKSVETPKDNVAKKIDLTAIDKNVYKSPLYQELLGAIASKGTDVDPNVRMSMDNLNKNQYSSKDIEPTHAQNSEKVIRGNYQKTASIDVKLNERQAKLKALNETLSLYEDEDLVTNDVLSDQIYDNADASMEVSMGNTFLDDLLDGGHELEAGANGAKEAQNSLWILSTILTVSLALIVYLHIRRRRVLQDVFLGNFDNISVEDAGSPYASKFHKTLKNLLNDGKFEEAMKLFRYEFRYRGMSLYDLCQYYGTFQKYGITDFATDTFLQELINEKKVVPSNAPKAPILQSPKTQSSGNLKNESQPHTAVKSASIITGSVSKKKNTPGKKEKKTKPTFGDATDLTGVSDNDVLTAKLNLATAYINMGDKHKANAILSEVEASGTTAQKREARRLLNKLTVTT